MYRLYIALLAFGLFACAPEQQKLNSAKTPQLALPAVTTPAQTLASTITNTNLSPGQSILLSVWGGTAPYTFQSDSNGSLSSIDTAKGIAFYTAGSNSATSIVRVSDSSSPVQSLIITIQIQGSSSGSGSSRTCFEEDYNKVVTLGTYPADNCADGGCFGALWAKNQYNVLCRYPDAYPGCAGNNPIIDAVLECPSNYGLYSWTLACHQVNSDPSTPSKTNTWWWDGTDMASATYAVCSANSGEKTVGQTMFIMQGHRKCCTRAQ